jgi:hypothetical protein
VTEGHKVLALFAASLAVGVGLVVGGPKLLALTGGPESELLSQLKSAESRGIEVPCQAGVLRSRSLSYQRLSVEVEGEQGVVSGTLDFTGTIGPIDVSSVGLERVTFSHSGFGWDLEGSWAPRLAALVNALEQRRKGLEAGEAVLPEDKALIGPLLPPRQYQVRAWYIRQERDETVVAEDYRVRGQTTDRPVDELGTRRMKWQVAPDGQFSLEVDQTKNPVILGE